MRFRHPDGTRVHLAYCSNVHPAEDLDGIRSQLADYCEPIRRRLGVERLGLGLWLAAGLASDLAEDPGILRRELDAHGLEVVSLNAFPYQGFHDKQVKGAVYHPDWSERARLDYTLDCVKVLAGLLPDDAERGSISTLPVAWREPWSPERQSFAMAHLRELASELAAEGRIRVGVEPEPGCLVETTEQAVRLLSELDPAWIGLCLDTCHLAVAHEEPAAALASLARAGIPVVKTQLSCAVRADTPLQRRMLARLDEQRFLHQTREPSDGGLLAADDLPQALAGGLPGVRPWRVHFHAPVHAEAVSSLPTTREDLLRSLTVLFGGPHPLTDHAEVETYTWSVLPGTPTRDEIVNGIAAELAWVADALIDLGLKVET